MAYTAAAAARTRFANDRSRTSSPGDDNTFATATATSFNRVIHSTPQREQNATDDAPFPHDQFQAEGDYDSEGDADMSIELGRGVKRNARRDIDISSELVFNIGNDNSEYEITATPPVGPRTNNAKTNASLRREASVRRATESARANDVFKRSASGAKQRGVSDNLHNAKATQQRGQGAATTVRTSRFVSSRSLSANYDAIPTRFTANGGLQTSQQAYQDRAEGIAAVESATYTASHSFLLPDMPDITELVSGTRKDGTPFTKRASAVRSRFVSASHRPFAQHHATIDGIKLPEDEKAILISLQHAREKTAQLEAERSEAQKRIEEFELEVAELKYQLELANRRPDSALGSEDDTLDARGIDTDKARLKGQVENLQDRLFKSERKTSVAEITSNRVVRERDGLVTQIATVYFQNEELSNENQELRSARDELSTENEALRKMVEELQDENAMLRNSKTTVKSGKRSFVNGDTEATHQDETTRKRQYRTTRKSEDAVYRQANDEHGTGKGRRRASSDHHDSTFERDIATRIEDEVRKMREDAASGARPRPVSSHDQRSTRERSTSRSKASVREETTSLKRHISAPVKSSTAASAPAIAKDRVKRQGSYQEDDYAIAQEDLTELSVIDAEDVANLRRKLEEERRSGRLTKRTSSEANEHTSRSVSRHGMPRKSSLKDLTGAMDSDTGRFSLGADATSRTTKTVRVQSPHSSQDLMEPEQQTGIGEFSTVDATSRRRRRTMSTEGMTSAFIVPDITLQGTQMPAVTGKGCIHHNAAKCTVCAREGEEVSIPQPVPASERDVGDVTDATVRPSQPPQEALAMVIKTLEDEIKHLKLQRESQNRLYNQHDPALSKRRRQDVKAKIDAFTIQIERRSDQVYALYDALEGFRKHEEVAKEPVTEQEVEETLQSIGLDPALLSGRVSRKAPPGLDDADDLSDESELPWEGLSDEESDQEFRGFGK